MNDGKILVSYNIKLVSIIVKTAIELAINNLGCIVTLIVV